MPGRPTADLEEQHAVLRGQFLVGSTSTQAYDYLCKAYGSAAMSKSNAKSTFKAYKDGRTEFRSQTGNHSTPRGSPKQRTEENIAKIQSLTDEEALNVLLALLLLMAALPEALHR